MNSNQVIVIGAGLGGMASAITLASKGYNVILYEKNSHAGGKLNFLAKDGFHFDLGPSILTMPFIFKNLFSLAGKQFEEYVSIEQLEIHWRNFFEDGSVIDLVRDYDEQKQLFSRCSLNLPKQFLRFLNYSHSQYRIVDKMYFRHGADDFFDVLKHIPLSELLNIDGISTMYSSIESFFSDPYIKDIFAYFAKYIGSSPYNAPGFLNLLPWIQYRYGLWYVKGGMHNLATGILRLLNELNVEVNFNTEVTSIITSGNKVKGVRLYNGREIPAAVVISNMEVIPAHKELLCVCQEKMKQFRRFEPSCSGLVVHLGVKKIYPQLAHHNFFHSSNSKDNFYAIFNKYRLPDDPTVYIVAPVRTDQTLAPKGCDIIKLLPHIPHLNKSCNYTRKDHELFKDRIIDKCERMGLSDLRKNIIVEDLMTPLDIQQLYYSTQGSIYGIVSDIRKNYGFKAPKQSSIYRNLFFSGGSVNPGGGMPMVISGGIHTGNLVEKRFPISKMSS